MFFFYIDIYVILNIKKCQYKKISLKNSTSSQRHDFSKDY